jgi:hypothetical protein
LSADLFVDFQIHQHSAIDIQQFSEVVDVAAVVIQMIVRFRARSARRREESPNSAGQCAG